MNLPIDVVPSRLPEPPKFRWRQVVTTPNGPASVECEGPVLPSMEQALVDLIGIAKQLALECEKLKLELAPKANLVPLRK